MFQQLEKVGGKAAKHAIGEDLQQMRYITCKIFQIIATQGNRPYCCLSFFYQGPTDHSLLDSKSYDKTMEKLLLFKILLPAMLKTKLTLKS